MIRRRATRAALATVVALLSAAVAAAQDQGPRWSGEPNCGSRFLRALGSDPALRLNELRLTVREWQGERIIDARGGIGENDARRITEALDRHWPVDEVWLHSNGGVALEGTAIGRALRQRGVGTRVPADAFCFSACTNAFLGGRVRIIEPGACYGVHMFTAWGGANSGERAESLATLILNTFANKPRSEAQRDLVRFLQGREQMAAHVARDQSKFLQEMGISAGFLNPVFDTAAPNGHWLTRGEIERYLIDNTRPRSSPEPNRDSGPPRPAP